MTGHRATGGHYGLSISALNIPRWHEVSWNKAQNKRVYSSLQVKLTRNWTTAQYLDSKTRENSNYNPLSMLYISTLDSRTCSTRSNVEDSGQKVRRLYNHHIQLPFSMSCRSVLRTMLWWHITCNFSSFYSAWLWHIFSVLGHSPSVD